MELSHHHHRSLLDELIMAPKMDTSPSPDDEQVGFLSNTWTTSLDNPLDDHHHQQQITAENANHFHVPLNTNHPSSFLELANSSSPEFINRNNPRPFGEFQPFLDALTSPDFCSFYDNKDDFSVPLMAAIHHQQDQYVGLLDSCAGVAAADSGGMSCGYNRSMIGGDEQQLSNFGNNNNNINNNNFDVNESDMYGGCDEEKKVSKSTKKIDGQPSKNLMAERRRRKRLNDRLSMLRSIVPKISKMDRTSILGDTIDYMKELLDKIHKLRREESISDEDQETNLVRKHNLFLKEQKPNEMQVRNPPKFDVERRKQDTRIEMCCTAKPGLLLSTLSTMDALGLDVQHCVISCFNDFCLQASCYELSEHRSIISCEDVKQALFRNAGYGGRCL